MGQLRAFDHVGITADDLDAATTFFVGLGLEVEGRTFVEGEFIDIVCASGTYGAPGAMPG
jgi:catechol 2,3-dioxygenase-like lactoylglutathione lyase family enzyme